MTDDFENIMASGFKLIQDMTEEELIDEICQGQRDQLKKMELNNLRSVLIDYRIGIYRKRTWMHCTRCMHKQSVY